MVCDSESNIADRSRQAPGSARMSGKPPLTGFPESAASRVAGDQEPRTPLTKEDFAAASFYLKKYLDIFMFI